MQCAWCLNVAPLALRNNERGLLNTINDTVPVSKAVILDRQLGESGQSKIDVDNRIEHYTRIDEH